MSRISPGFALLAIVCFFFAFSSVSCNTDSAKQTLHTAAGLTGSQSDTARLDACLDSLKGVSLFSYTGFQLAFGGTPNGLQTVPAGCRSSQTALPTGAAAPQPEQAAIGAQPLVLAAFVLAVLGVVAGSAGLVRALRGALQLMCTALLALAAVVCLVLGVSHAQTAVLDRIDSLAAGNGAPFSLAAYFTQQSGVAYFLAIAALALAALSSAAPLLMRPPPGASRPRAPD